MAKLSEQDIKYLAAYDMSPDEEAPPPEFPECEGPAPKTDDSKLWWPELNDVQLEAFNDYTKYTLYHSERFSGKSWCVGHKAVRHCWENWDALCLITTYTLTGLTEGLLEDLVKDILPEWERNIGLTWVGPKTNISKTTFIKVANCYGGWSTIIFKPCPSVSIISERFKPIKASMIIFEEMGDKNDERFLNQLSQQLRRKHVKNQQFIAVTNPPKEGPKHYLYERFFVGPKPTKEEEEKGEYSQETKDALERFRTNWRHIHFPVQKNKWRDWEAYLNDIRDNNRHDPNMVDRLVRGEWVEQQLGEGIFKDFFIPNIHIKGNVAENRQLIPQPGMPIVLGGDMGDVNNGFSFLQQVYMKKKQPDGREVEKIVWMQLDELEIVGKKLSIPQLTHMILEKMNRLVMRGAQAKGMDLPQAVQELRFEFIADSSTLRFRQGGGDIERNLVRDASKEILNKYAAQYPYVTQPIMFKPAPKGDGSVSFRVKMLIEMLQTERYVVDSSCVRTIEMFKQITSSNKEGGSPFDPSGKSPYKHILDAVTYPIVYHVVRGDTKPEKEKLKPMYY